ncbi:MAG: RagB/SusD family nutrient uptake outer membrane protein [Balneola sp.]|nr:MAG: RagB/SusD family nutrient uptake outer membrane protein [Balneola sp.]
MNKLRFIKIAALSLLLVGGIACDDIFDVEPSTAISTSDALGSAAGIDGLRTNMYSKILTSFDMTTEHFVGASALADETCNRQGSTRFQAQCTAIGTSGTTHLGSFGAYEVIQEANLLINEIPDGLIDDATRDQYRGEALAIRALAYHLLVRAYAYEPGQFSNGPTANWDAGVMLRTDATTDLTDAEPVARSTVNQVYTQILADLTEAESLLSANADLLSANGFATYEFVLGLRARVLLYQGEWAAAATAAQTAITASGLSLVSDSAGVGSMWFQANPEALFEIKVNASTENIAGSNANSGLAVYTSVQWVSQVPTNYTMDTYSADDWRLSGWYATCIQEGCTATNDEGVAVMKWNGYKGNFVDDIPFMRVAELYLIQAEAAAKASGVASGIAPLNTLRTARGLATVAAGDFADVTAFEDEILLERTRELIVEGHRFWDLKRLGRAIPDGDGGTKMRADSYRLLAPFGTAYQAVNPLAVENPDYAVLED